MLSRKDIVKILLLDRPVLNVMISFVLHQHVPYWRFFVAVMKIPIV
jgi:hypothetical protein